MYLCEPWNRNPQEKDPRKKHGYREKKLSVFNTKNENQKNCGNYY